MSPVGCPGPSTSIAGCQLEAPLNPTFQLRGVPATVGSTGGAAWYSCLDSRLAFPYASVGRLEFGVVLSLTISQAK